MARAEFTRDLLVLSGGRHRPLLTRTISALRADGLLVRFQHGSRKWRTNLLTPKGRGRVRVIIESLRAGIRLEDIPPIGDFRGSGDALERADRLELEAVEDWERDQIDDPRALARRYNMPPGLWMYRDGLGLNSRAVAGDATIGRCFSRHHAWALEAGRDAHVRLAYATVIAYGRLALAAPTMRHRILWQAGRLGARTTNAVRAAALGIPGLEYRLRDRLLAATDPLDLSGWEELLDFLSIPLGRGTSNPDVPGTLHDVRARILPARSIFFGPSDSDGYAPRYMVSQDQELVREGRIAV